MQRFVMFGHNHLFGDIVDIIHACGGMLTRIVQNMVEPAHPSRKSLRERLQKIPYPIEVEALEDFSPATDEHYILGFTGYKLKSLKIELSTRFGLHFDSLIHPTAIISPTVEVGEGCIINAGSIVASGVKIGNHVFINRGASVGHDTVLDDYSIIQPGANVAGHVKIGVGSVISIGASVIEDISVGAHSVVAAGAAVVHDVPERTLVAGVPAEHKKALV